MKKIIVLIPCLNEEEGIADVIAGIPHTELKKFGYKSVAVVIDNGSTDKTTDIARKKGAIVLIEKRKGKGNALRTGFKYAKKSSDFVVMVDGDNTYNTSEILRLIEPLDSNFTDVVIGSRLAGNLLEGSFSARNKFGDAIISFLVRSFYKRANLTDALSGFVAWRTPVVKKLEQHIESGGFGIEMEMIAKMNNLGFNMHSVPITYSKRSGVQKIVVWDSLKILYAFAAYYRWKPPRVK